MKKYLSLALPLVLTACGGGGSGPDNSSSSVTPASVQPATNVTVNISASNANPYQGDGYTLSWTSNAKTCVAGGDWSGSLDAIGSKFIQNATIASRTYNITCSDSNKSASALVTVNTVEKPYFVEVSQAFPDPTNYYWFFDKSQPNNRYPSNLIAVNSADLNGDGKKEIVMVFTKGLGNDVYFGQYVSEPCQSTTVVYELNGDKFVDATDKYLESERNFSACVDQNSIVVDINGDGKPDFFYSTHQEDGRLSQTGSLMDAQLVGWVSQPNGKYKIIRYAERKWYHSIGTGLDSNGKTFVIGAGFPDNNTQNTRYSWINNTLSPVYDTNMPNMSAVSFVFLNNSGKNSNILIQQTFALQLGAEGYVRNTNGWTKTNSVTLPYTVAGTENFVVWNGDTRKIQVLNYNGKYIAGTGAGGNLDNLCSLKLHKDKDPVAAGTYSIPVVPNYTPGKTINENDLNVQFMPVYLFVENNQLNVKPLIIKGETDFPPARFQCIDINNDGYDDLVLHVGKNKSINSLRIYMNQKDGTFAKVNMGSSALLSLVSYIDLYASYMDDFNGDGVMDVIVYASNPGFKQQSGQPLKVLTDAIKFYKGMKPVQ